MFKHQKTWNFDIKSCSRAAGCHKVTEKLIFLISTGPITLFSTFLFDFGTFFFLLIFAFFLSFSRTFEIVRLHLYKKMTECKSSSLLFIREYFWRESSDHESLRKPPFCPRKWIRYDYVGGSLSERVGFSDERFSSVAQFSRLSLTGCRYWLANQIRFHNTGKKINEKSGFFSSRAEWLLAQQIKKRGPQTTREIVLIQKWVKFED